MPPQRHTKTKQQHKHCISWLPKHSNTPREKMQHKELQANPYTEGLWIQPFGTCRHGKKMVNHFRGRQTSSEIQRTLPQR
eukprot:7140861-Ditylum_brightwellii.AAC.1